MDATAYPKRYTAAVGWKVLLCVLGLVLGLGGLAGAWYFISGHEVHSTTQLVVMAVVSLGIAGLGFTCAFGSFSTILVLKPDALEIPGVFRSKMICRADIRGFRVLNIQGINALQLEWRHPITGKAKRTNISMLFKPDAALLDWFEGITNLDAVELAASVEEVAADPQLGASADERLDNVNRASKIARALFFVLIGSSVWALFYPHPYTLVFALMAGLPLLVLWLCWKYKGSFSIEDAGPNTARADLSGVLLVPGMILALRALMDVHLARPVDLLAPALAGLALVLCLVVWIAPAYRRRPFKLLLVAAVMIPYPASLVAIGNAVLDPDPAERYRVQVLQKRYTTGKGASQYFTVSAWGPYAAGYELQVPGDLYRATQIGQTVCVLRHAGAFRLEWHTVHAAQAC